VVPIETWCTKAKSGSALSRVGTRKGILSIEINKMTYNQISFWQLGTVQHFVSVVKSVLFFTDCVLMSCDHKALKMMMMMMMTMTMTMTMMMTIFMFYIYMLLLFDVSILIYIFLLFNIFYIFCSYLYIFSILQSKTWCRGVNFFLFCFFNPFILVIMFVRQVGGGRGRRGWPSRRATSNRNGWSQTPDRCHYNRSYKSSRQHWSC